MTWMMKSRSQSIVHRALAAYLGIPAFTIEDRQRLDRDLGLDAFDLALLSMRLEDELEQAVRIPVDRLNPSMTVDRLTALFDASLEAASAEIDAEDDEAPDTERTELTSPSTRRSLRRDSYA